MPSASPAQDHRGHPPHARADSDAVTPAVVVAGLHKSFDEVEAVRGIDFVVGVGETFGFLGPNGAGKSTTINMLCTLMRPSAGAATVAGHDVVRERDQVRRNIGLVFQDTTLDSYLTAEQNLRLHAELYGDPRAPVGPHMRDAMEMEELWEMRKHLIGTVAVDIRLRIE